MQLSRFKPKRESKKKEYLVRTPVFNLSGGVKKNLPPFEIEERFMADCLNVYIKDGKVCSRPGYSAFGNGLPLASRPIMNIEQFFKYDGTEYLCVFTDKLIYKYNTSTEYWDIISPQLVVEDCEDAWVASANVTDTNDTTYVRYGTNARKLTVAAGFTTGLVAYENFASKDISTYTHISCYVRSSVALTAGQLQLLLDNTNGCVSPTETINFPAIAANTTTEMLLTIAVPGNCNALLSVGLNLASDPGACDIYIDQIYAVKCMTVVPGTHRIKCESIYDDDSAEMKFIMTNGVDNIMFWNGTGNWADLAGSPNKAKLIRNFNYHLLLMAVTNTGTLFPQRIDWCDQGDPKNWSTGSSGYNNLASTQDGIVSEAFIKGNLAIFKENSISTATYTGGTDPFYFEENKIKDCGASCDGGTQSLGDFIAFLGWDNVYAFDGFGTKAIADNIAKEIIDFINPDKLSTIHTHILEELGLYLLFITTANEDYPDMIYVWSYAENWWTIWKFHKPMSCSGFTTQASAVTIGEMLGTIGSYTDRIGTKSLLSVHTASLWGSYDGYIYKSNTGDRTDSGTYIQAYFDSKTFMPAGLNNYNRFQAVELYGLGTQVDVLISSDEGSTFYNKGNIDMSTSDRTAMFLRTIEATVERGMFRFSTVESGDWFEIDGFELISIAKDKIVN